MISCIKANLCDEQHSKAIVYLLDLYAADPMGGGEELSQYTKENVIANLREFPTTLIFLAKSDENFVGLAICFQGFSTFHCRKLLNIHDFVVHPHFRRKGVGFELMMCIDQFARSIDCCKITLEVLEGNHAAKALYSTSGFESYELDPAVGHALFWQKKL